MPEMGNFRWLTVGPASQPDFAVVLMADPGRAGASTTRPASRSAR